MQSERDKTYEAVMTLVCILGSTLIYLIIVVLRWLF